MLETEGVRPDADVENGGVKAVHRRTGDLDLYALVNRTGEDITTTVSLLGRPGNVPYTLDPWSGKVAAGRRLRPVGRLAPPLEVTIEAGSTELVALAGRRFTGSTVPSRHVVSHGRGGCLVERRRLTLRADEAGPSPRGSATAEASAPR